MLSYFVDACHRRPSFSAFKPLHARLFPRVVSSCRTRSSGLCKCSLVATCREQPPKSIFGSLQIYAIIASFTVYPLICVYETPYLFK